MSQDLLDLARTLTLTDPRADSWDWLDDGIYIDCSRQEDGAYRLEVGTDDDAVQIDLHLDDLREIHRRMTTALIAAQMRQS